MAEPITRDQFALTCGQNYRLFAETSVDVKLIAVTERKDCGGGFESFSLLFEGDENAAVSQRTYKMQNDAIGQTNIFISPIHYPQGICGKSYFQAVFSYLLS
jgi:hypothetical protein